MERATLYYHVEGKEDLLYAICKSSIEQLDSDVIEATEGISDPLTQLQVGIQAHVVSLLRDQTQHATSLAEARSLSPERLAEIVSRRKAYQARARSVLEAGQGAGSIRRDISSKYLGMMLERSAGSDSGLVQAEWRTEPVGAGRNSMPLVPRGCAGSSQRCLRWRTAFKPRSWRRRSCSLSNTFER